MTMTTKNNKLDSLNWFFKYHAGQGKFLTIWPVNNGQRSEELTISQFLKLPVGFRFSINGADRIYSITSKGIE